MGIHRENGGYSATIEAFLVVDGERFRVAKTNASDFTLADTCELAPGTAGNLLIIVDGYEDSSQVTLPDGVLAGQTVVNCTVTGPF